MDYGDMPGVLIGECAEEALRVLRQKAYYADRVDWPRVKGEVAGLLAGGADLVSALRPAWRALGDGHSHLRPSEAAALRGSAAVQSTPTGRRLAGGIGYLTIPAFAGDPRGEDALDYVRVAWRCLAKGSPRGWLLDLRANTGGSIVPMLAAVGPLLGPGEWLRYRRPDGSSLSFDYDAGALRVGDRIMLTLPKPPADTPTTPVAVLVGRRTASAAEGVLVAFRGRVRTRVFGTPTAGVPTGNAAHRLANGSLLLIATSVAVDRHGHEYAERITPDSRGGLAGAHAWLVSAHH
jgi:carboxyl-terminal processing protease